MHCFIFGLFVAKLSALKLRKKNKKAPLLPRHNIAMHFDSRDGDLPWEGNKDGALNPLSECRFADALKSLSVPSTGGERNRWIYGFFSRCV